MIIHIPHPSAPVRLESLRGKRAFRLLFASGKRLLHPSLVLIVRYRAQPQQTPPYRIAFGVSIRRGSSAVVRNRVRRLLRESLRQYFFEHPADARIFDALILIWRRHPPKPSRLQLKDVYPVVSQMLRQAVRQYEEQMAT